MYGVPDGNRRDRGSGCDAVPVRVGHKPERPEYAFAQKMVGIQKVVFSKTVHRMDGKSVRVESGDLVDA